jgi:hypothetical protein
MRPARYLARRTGVAATCPAGCWLERAPGGGTYCNCDYNYAVSSPLVAFADSATPTATPAADPTLQAAVDTAKGYIESGVTAAMIYHGYRRTGSILWALLYGLAGKEVPAVALPIAIAQGFGQRKPCPAP